MTKPSHDLLLLAESLVAFGRKKGVDQIEVSIGEGSEFSVDVRAGEIETLVEAGSKGLSLRIIHDQRVATASSSDLSQDTLHRLVDHAIERAKISSPDPFAGLPEYQEITTRIEALDLFDGEIVGMTPEKKIDAARTTEALCLKDKRIQKTYGASFGTYIGSIYLANSAGFSESYSQTSCLCGVYLQAGEGDNLFDEGKYDFSRSLANLMTPEAIAREAIHRVTRLIGAQKIKSQNVPVVFEPQMTASLLGFFCHCIMGSSVYLKQSFLADRLGEKIGNINANIVDDGLMPGVPGAKPFDGEGVPVGKTILLENGTLKNFLLDTYAGRKLNMASTGHASGPNNVYFVPGEFSQTDIIASVDRGFLLTGTIGHGTVPTTGDFSRGAFGLWIENGEVVYPVAEVTISGNLGTILNEIEMVGNDLEFKRSINGPTIKIKEMTMGGL